MAEESSEIKGYTHVPTASLKRDPLWREHMKDSAQKTEDDANNYREILAQIEVKDKHLDKIVTAAKTDLVELYANAGITLTDEDFPPIFLIPIEKKQEVDSMRLSGGSFGGVSIAAVVYVHSEALRLLDAQKIHHELHHGIGRVILGSHKQGDEITTHLLQTGHYTTSPDEQSRGLALEEGTMEYFARRFITNSNDTEIRRIRRYTTESLAPQQGESISWRESLFGIKNQEKLSRVINSLLSVPSIQKYNYARNVVNLIVSRATNIDGETGTKYMEKLLLQTRRMPEKKRELIGYMNTLFSPEDTQLVFKTSMDSSQLEYINKKLGRTA